MESREYYKSIGFMCGLEIHQRLLSSEKLFCSCAAEPAKDAETGRIRRRMRAVAGELGKTDASAEFEEQKQREFIYRTFASSTCLVETDEEPPHQMNTVVLGTALAIAKSMGMRTVDELQPMRKAVVDGSDPSAFQRTVLVALDGKIVVNNNTVAVPSMFLEEESCGISESDASAAVYDTNRLGIPLIEIDTDASIPDPITAKEVALYIGTLLRITGKVQRGIGSIRQDVNISIKGGARVEIKGMQELDQIDRMIDNEIKRQQELIKIKEGLVGAKARVERPVDLAAIFERTGVKMLAKKRVVGFRLAGFGGFLGREINPQRRLGSEISDYAKMAGVGGIIHSDEDLNRYGFSADEIAKVRDALSISKGDAFVLIAGNAENAARAATIAAWRAEYAMTGVPKETRGPNGGELCTSRFLRPLPGGSRMYPETDIRPITVTAEMLQEAQKAVPNLEKERAFIRSKVKNEKIADQLLLSTRLQLFKDIVGRTGADPEFVANTLVQKFTELRRQGYDCDAVDGKAVAEIFDRYAEREITKQAVEELAKALAKGGTTIDETIKANKLKRITGKSLEKILASELKEKKAPEAVKSIMARYRLVVDGTELNELASRAARVARGGEARAKANRGREGERGSRPEG
jgi:glutamyl-tRNA(Gln) amidotransferase subunit E